MARPVSATRRPSATCAGQFPKDRLSYTNGKTAVIEALLADYADVPPSR